MDDYDDIYLSNEDNKTNLVNLEDGDDDDDDGITTSFRYLDSDDEHHPEGMRLIIREKILSWITSVAAECKKASFSNMG
jgi:hypothetical protein